jgi:hypothetical protein
MSEPQCTVCNDTKEYRFVDYNRTEGDAPYTARVAPCPYCCPRVERTMTLNGWQRALEYMNDVLDDKQRAEVASWENIVDAGTTDVEITITIPEAFDDEIERMIDDYRMEQLYGW